MLVTFSIFPATRRAISTWQKIYKKYFEHPLKDYSKRLLCFWHIYSMVSREIVTATKTPYRTKWPMCKEPDPYPRNKQEANCLSTHSLQLIFTSVHSLRSTLENKVSPFVCMEAQRCLLEVISMTSIVVTPHKVKESPIASSREVVPFLSYFPQYGS